MKFLKITFLLSILALASCGKETLTTISDEHFVFAVYYGDVRKLFYRLLKCRGKIFPDTLKILAIQEEYDFLLLALSQKI
ncbi:MAG: hypothetical protein R2784_12520 [Saprospiraceae bacterium]